MKSRKACQFSVGAFPCCWPTEFKFHVLLRLWTEFNFQEGNVLFSLKLGCKYFGDRNLYLFREFTGQPQKLKIFILYVCVFWHNLGCFSFFGKSFQVFIRRQQFYNSHVLIYYSSSGLKIIGVSAYGGSLRMSLL